MAARRQTARPLAWKIDPIVCELRSLRDASLAERRRRGRPAKLPSRRLLAEAAEGLESALFPNRLGSRELADESVDFFVGHTLDLTLRELAQQIARELQFSSSEDLDRQSCIEHASEIVRQFAERLPGIRRLLESDLRSAYEADQSATSIDEVLACSPGITAIAHHRLAHALFVLGAPLVARIIAETARSLTGIDIHPGAHIGGRFFIEHGMGVVIGETTVIGERVRLYQSVTLGAVRAADSESRVNRRGEKPVPRHPIVEDDVVIYAGATILGPVTIGRGSVIGGNVWLIENVPPGSRVTQAEVRSEEFDGGSGI